MSDLDGDIAIIGGGIMGSAIAYFLTANPAFHGKILVIERDPTYEICATTRSWGGIRKQFSLEENIRISQFMFEFMPQIPDLLALEDERPDVGFTDNGYLFLAGDQGAETLRRLAIEQNRCGANTTLLEKSDLEARFPWLNSADLTVGAYGGGIEGWLDPHALLMAFRRKARSLGAVYLADEVVDARRVGNAITALELRDGGPLRAGIVINAAGPWAGRVAAMMDCPLPVEPRKRMTYVFDCRAPLPAMPLTIDPSGMAFRPESGQFLAIHPPPEEEDRGDDDMTLDLEPFEASIWPALAHRVPAFEAIKLSRAWAGLYDYNFFDQNAIIGAHPEIANLYFCNGFSGHGIQQAAAAGRAISELILYGAFQTLDLSRLGYERILSGQPLREVHIV